MPIKQAMTIQPEQDNNADLFERANAIYAQGNVRPFVVRPKTQEEIAADLTPSDGNAHETLVLLKYRRQLAALNGQTSTRVIPSS